MRAATLISLIVTCSLQAQVVLDVPLRSIGPDGQRGIEGVAMPDDNTSAITVEASLMGMAHWAEASVQDSLITLLQAPEAAGYRPGMTMRFLATADQYGEVLLRVGELDALPLLRPDGAPPALGQLKEGRVAEVLFATNRWVLMSAAERGCPMGTVQVQADLCIQIEDIPGMRFYDAMDHCAALGGKLCTRDEYFLACSLLEDQLNGLFNSWEWIDDTANHDHTGDQVAVTSCFEHRSTNVLSSFGDTRCCFHPR